MLKIRFFLFFTVIFFHLAFGKQEDDSEISDFDISMSAASTFVIDNQTHFNDNFRGDGNFDHFRANIYMNYYASEKVSIFSQFTMYTNVRTKKNFFVPDGAWLRYQASEDFLIKGGILPTMFGVYTDYTDVGKNDFISIPLLYQFHQANQSNSIDASFKYLPISYAACWGSGVEFEKEFAQLRVAFGIKNDATSNPIASSHLNKPTFEYRVVYDFLGDLSLGATGSLGFYSPSYLKTTYPDFKTDEAKQSLHGLFIDYQGEKLAFLMELFYNQLDYPKRGTSGGELDPLVNYGGYIQARYNLSNRLYLASRFDMIQHQKNWYANLMRVDIVAGYYLDSNFILKLSYQTLSLDKDKAIPSFNQTTDKKPEESFFAVQIVATL